MGNLGFIDTLKKIGLIILLGVPLWGSVPPPPPHLLSQMGSPTLHFKILKGYGKVNVIGGFADGEYKLKKWEIKKESPELYHFKLIYSKKKGHFHWVQELNLYGKLRGSTLYLYDPQTEKLYRLNFKPILHAQKVKGGYNFYYIYPTRSLWITRGRSKFYLTIKSFGEE